MRSDEGGGGGWTLTVQGTQKAPARNGEGISALEWRVPHRKGQR
jgi:hypothetical protein